MSAARKKEEISPGDSALLISIVIVIVIVLLTPCSFNNLYTHSTLKLHPLDSSSSYTGPSTMAKNNSSSPDSETSAGRQRHRDHRYSSWPELSHTASTWRPPPTSMPMFHSGLRVVPGGQERMIDGEETTTAMVSRTCLLGLFMCRACYARFH